MLTVRIINYIITVLFFICYFYQFIYMIVAMFARRRRPAAAVMHSYAVLIAARNEEEVIVNLIDSIKAQTYPSNKVTIFVIADNCTDNTAGAASAAGAVVYERQNAVKVGKGYALDFLLECIARDYPEGAFDGYFVFDADNILENDFIERMNETFSQGYEIVTSYRNSKNFGDNWISAGYSLWFIRNSQSLNKARHTLGASCFVNGTGFLFSDNILKQNGGWKHFLLTEDAEFTAYNIVGGVKIGYCEDAMLYDEQPTGFKQSVRQRLRWAKGYLQVMGKYGAKLSRGIFGRRGFCCYDMLMAISPAFILSVISVMVNFTGLLVSLPNLVDAADVITSIAETLLKGYALFFAIGAFTTITEWRHIHCSAVKKIAYLFTFPVFMATYIPISFAAIFIRVEWKPIKHARALRLSEVKTGATGNGN